MSTPVFQELIGWRLYPMHAFFCAISFVLVYFRELGHDSPILSLMSSLSRNSRRKSCCLFYFLCHADRLAGAFGGDGQVVRRR